MSDSPLMRTCRMAGDTFTDVATFQISGHAILEAAWNGKMKLLKTLVEGGTDPNYSNADGQTPLMALCARPWGPNLKYAMPLIKYLLSKNANTNIQDRFGKTALVYACALNQDPPLISYLLDAGADLFIEDKLGFTPLVYAYNAHNDELTHLLSTYCKAEGREMVLLETRLDRNFLSYLKIQKRLGVSKNSVMVGEREFQKQGHIAGVPEGLTKLFNRTASSKLSNPISPPPSEGRKMSAQPFSRNNEEESSGGSKLSTTLRRFSATALSPQLLHRKKSRDEAVSPTAPTVSGGLLGQAGAHYHSSIEITVDDLGNTKGVHSTGTQCALIGSPEVEELYDGPAVMADITELPPELLTEEQQRKDREQKNDIEEVKSANQITARDIASQLSSLGLQ